MSDERGEQVCVILGAGASHDVRNPDGSPEDYPDLKPPLAEKLFDGTNNECRAILDKYPGAGTLAQNLVYDLANGAKFEDRLRHYAHHPTSEGLREGFKDVPPYLRDFIWRCSERYTPWPSGYIRLVTELLGENQYNVLFLVLNYDNLLEKALSSVFSYTFNKMDDYVAPERAAKVIKIHGSVNWFIPLPWRTSTWDEAVERLDVRERPNEIDIRVIARNATKEGRQGRTDLWEWDYDPWVYPVLTAPLAGKDLENIVCPSTHRGFAESFVATCRKYLIIGSSGTDDDLMKLLDGAIPADEPMNFVHVVGKEGTDGTRDNFKQGVTAFRENAIFSEFYEGFQRYLIDPAFKSFFDAPL